MRISLEKASELLKSGNVIAVPTETVYGLAASLDCPEAVQKIFHLKGRPSNNPLIIHVAHLKDVFFFLQDHISDLDILARDLWPGPMTLILPIKCKLVSSVARADLPTAAFRIPQHPLTLELLKKTGPLVMPSANLSGRPSSTSPEHVENDFGSHFPVLDGGKSSQGLESTIMMQQKGRWEIIREGALSQDHFEKSLGYLPKISEKSSSPNPLCPGQLYRHYAPAAELKLVHSFENIEEGVVIGFSDKTYPSKCHLLSLGPLADPSIAAANLYDILRRLDQERHPLAYVDMNFPKNGILSTLAERLQKAAAKL